MTSDVRTLAKELDSAVTHLSVNEFWSRHISPTPPPNTKEVSGDYSDIEAEFLRRDRLAAAETAPAPRPRRSTGIPAPLPAATKNRPAAKATIKPSPGPSEAAQQEQVRLKRERGRLRQARRLARYRRR